MDRVSLRSYAKINLTLEVFPARSDGYHDIDSVVQVIDLWDEMDVCRCDAAGITLNVDDTDIPTDGRNTIVMAAKAFFEYTQIAGGAQFTLRKRIPVQAGLGGGSGNAAAALIALNKLFETDLDAPTLAKLAATVGSDAALFIYGGTVRMKGRGEIIELLPDAPCLDVVVVKPDCGVSTAWAYAQLDSQGILNDARTSNACASAITANDREGLLSALHNSFERPICSALPQIEKARRVVLDQGSSHVMLCGSGACVFGVFEDAGQANAAAKALAGSFPFVWSGRTMGRIVGA